MFEYIYQSWSEMFAAFAQALHMSIVTLECWMKVATSGCFVIFCFAMSLVCWYFYDLLLRSSKSDFFGAVFEILVVIFGLMACVSSVFFFVHNAWKFLF